MSILPKLPTVYLLPRGLLTPTPPPKKTPAEEFFESFGMLGKNVADILGASND